MKKAMFVLVICLGFVLAAKSAPTEVNMMDELDPYSPNIQETLKVMDQQYEAETGMSALANSLNIFSSGCYQIECAVFAHVDKGSQRLQLYVNGILQATWKTSTGVEGHGTPDMDTHPDGRIYDAYTSSKYPGGDYNGLGNMPYAIFIQGGFAIHGTGEGNWSKLGRPASHGCVRVHPDNAKVFNRLVRQYGVNNTWITVD